jgi:hypothetical protein
LRYAVAELDFIPLYIPMSQLRDIIELLPLVQADQGEVTFYIPPTRLSMFSCTTLQFVKISNSFLVSQPVWCFDPRTAISAPGVLRSTLTM